MHYQQDGEKTGMNRIDLRRNIRNREQQSETLRRLFLYPHISQIFSDPTSLSTIVDNSKCFGMPQVMYN